MRRIIWALLLVVLTAIPAIAEDRAWHMMVSPSGIGFYYLPQLAFFEPEGEIDDTSDIAFGPTDGVTLDLGRPEAPWNIIYATGYNVGGRPGLSIDVPLGTGCTLRFRGGLLVAVKGTGIFQTCSLP